VKEIDYIPTFRFIVALVLFGLFWFVFDPIINGLSSFFGVTPASGIYAQAMFFLWMVLPVINLFGSGVKLVMEMQRQ